MPNNGYARGYGLPMLIPSESGYTSYSPIQFVQPKSKVLRKAVWTQAYWWNPPFGRPRDIDYPELEKYENNIWIKMVTGHIIDSVVRTKWNIVSVNEEKEAPESHITEVAEFLSSKTWVESWRETLRRVLPDLLLYDCGTIVKVFGKKDYDENGELKNKNAKPVELMARDGRAFLKDTDLYGITNRFWMYSWINPTGKPISFACNEIIYLMMRPQSRSPYGISSLEIVQSVVDYLSSSVMANRKYWENGIFVGGQIDHPDMVDPDELLERAQLYKEQLKGEDNYNSWMVTSGGVKVTPLAFTNQQMQWLETSEFFGRLIFAIFKITPSELGFTDQLNRATGIQQSKVYKAEGVKTILSLLEEYVNREIVWKHFEQDVKFQFDTSLDLQDEKLRTDIDHVQIVDGIITINEIRNRDGKDTFEDEEFDKPFAMQSYQQKLMMESGGMGGEYGEEESEPKEYDEEKETEEEKVEKAVTAGAASGEPGYLLSPIVVDRKKKKQKKMEDDAVTDLTTWGSGQRKLIEKELSRLYRD